MGVARWIKFDFHTHTPASRCFKNRETVTPRQWINAVKDSGLNAVLVTDHNSVEWIGKLRSELEREDKLFIYPGVELCVGPSRTHIIVIFDPDMKTIEIEQFLIQCDILKENWGNPEIHVEEDRLAKMINKYRPKVLVIPAHFNGNRGICKTVGHHGIKSLYKTFYFDAIEVRNDDDLREVENKVRNKAIPRLALVTGSDNPGPKQGTHDLSGFGEKHTWVKISEYSLEALRQVFLDPQTRCYCVMNEEDKKLDFNYIEHNYISQMKIKNLIHVDELDFRLSPNLNCIIGGRGTGKSTIVEMIRYTLNKFDEKKPLKIFNTYRDNSRIEIDYNFGSDNCYRLSLSGKNSNKKLEVEHKDGKTKDYPAFPVSIYSQKELFSIAEDDDDPEKNDTSPLLNIIDDNILREKAEFQEKKEVIKRDIIDLTEQLLIDKDRIKGIPRLKAEIELDTSKISKIKSAGLLEKREELNRIRKYYNAITTDLEDYSKTIDELQRTFFDKGDEIIQRIKINLSGEVISDEDKDILNSICNINSDLIEALNTSKVRVNQTISKFSESKLKKEQDRISDEYTKLLGKLEHIDINDFKQIEANITEKKIQLDELRVVQDKVNKTAKQITNKVLEYIDVHDEITRERKKIIDEINSKANNIKLSIYSMCDGERWLYKIRSELGKERSFSNDFEKLKNKLFPNCILDKNQLAKWLKFILLSDDGDIKEFLWENELYDSRFSNIWIEKKKDKTLHTLINFIPEDKIHIQIESNNTTISLNEGSPGQKTAAILTFILSQGEHPLIIDQPEDDLDNSLIIDLIVENIRKLKNNRQVIIATHNPNIPVLGDAEGIIMLDRNENGKVIFKDGKKTGCIEEKTIKKGICDIMEGGIGAIRKRERKYRYVEI